MIKNRLNILALCIACLSLTNCQNERKDKHYSFDELNRTITIDNWQYALRVENQNKMKGIDSTVLKDHYLKATLYMSNNKTKKSLLYSISKNTEDYEEKYKYLSFDCKEGLFIQYKNMTIYPIGYVFEPSNGLSSSERLVYKFQVPDDVYKTMAQDNDAVEYWYIDRLSGLGKICFKQQ